MANTKQAKKRAKQAEKHRIHNASRKSEMRTYIKNVIKLLESGDIAKATETYKSATSMVDKLANKGLIHKNKAARHKSRLSAHIKKAEEATK